MSSNSKENAESDLVTNLFFASPEMSNQVPQAADEIIQNIESEELKFFAQRAVEALYGAFNQASDRFRGEVQRAAVDQAIATWLTHPDHGAAHCLDVRNRMRQFRDEELAAGNSEFQISDNKIDMLAILHDFGYLLPVMTLSGEMLSVSEEYKAKNHPLLITAAVYTLGQEMDLSRIDILPIAGALRHHDDFFARPSLEQSDKLRAKTPYSAWLLADADRCVGANAKETFKRNRKGSKGKWYFFNHFLEAAGRASWRNNTRGLYDGMSAILAEYAYQEHWLHTAAGREFYKKKVVGYEDGLVNFYLEEYQRDWITLDQAIADKKEIKVGIKGGQFIETISTVRDGRPITQAELQAEMLRIMQIPVAGKNDGEQQYYGYSLFVPSEKDGEGDWVDPSITAFASTSLLATVFRTAIKNYSTHFNPNRTEESDDLYY